MENLDSLSGDAAGTQIIESVPSTGSGAPVVEPGGESSPPSSAPPVSDTPPTDAAADTDTPAVDAVPPPTRAELLAHAKALSPEERAAFGKDIRILDEINADYQRDLARGVQTTRIQLEKQLREEGELRQAMERDLSWFKTEQGQQALLSGNPQVAARHAEVVGWLSNQTEAPIRVRMESQFTEDATKNIRAGFEARPELKLAADHWEEISKDLSGSGAERVAGLVSNALDVLAKQQYAQIERKYRAEMAAKVSDGVAERVHGIDEPVLVGAGVGTNGFKSLEEARAAHIRFEITDDQMRQYLRRFGHE